MSQDRKEALERFKAAEARVRSGESEVEEVELPSGRVRLARDESAPNGLKIEVLDGGSHEGGGPSPDPKTLEAMERMKNVMAQFKAGDLDSAEITLPTGGTVRLSRSSEAPGAFTVQGEDGGPAMHSIPFEESTERPDTYPEDLPFLPGVKVSVSRFEGRAGCTVGWFDLPDPDAALDELRDQMLEAGWEGGEPTRTSTPFGTMTVLELRKGGRTRGLMLQRFGDHNKITLMEAGQKQD
jgi:hypothetical protein